MSTEQRTWTDREAVTLDGARITLSEPVPVGRSKGYFWFPTLHRLPHGDLLASIDSCPDIHISALASHITWSRDGGLTWSEPVIAQDGGEMMLNRTSGDTILLPFELRPRPGGMGAPYNRFPAGKRTFEYVASGTVVTGWPAPDRPKEPGLDVAGFSFDGQALPAKDGTYLGTMYGRFAGDDIYSSVLAQSTDGVHWTFRSVIADKRTSVPCGEGPNECTICRLKDGRLMSVFRVGSYYPYGQTWSSDEGLTWTPAMAMRGPFSVQPSLAVLDDGMIALSGGRPGLHLWLNADGAGLDWQRVEVMTHHDRCCPGETIGATDGTLAHRTTSYTEIVALDANHLLYLYDRCPNRWQRIPEEMNDTNSVWVVRVTVERT